MTAPRRAVDLLAIDVEDFDRIGDPTSRLTADIVASQIERLGGRRV
jgi:hypothetical protein